MSGTRNVIRSSGSSRLLVLARGGGTGVERMMNCSHNPPRSELNDIPPLVLHPTSYIPHPIPFHPILSYHIAFHRTVAYGYSGDFPRPTSHLPRPPIRSPRPIILRRILYAPDRTMAFPCRSGSGMFGQLARLIADELRSNQPLIHCPLTDA